MKELHKALTTANTPIIIICDGLFNEEHNEWHRMGVGTVVMLVGAGLAKGGGLIGYEIVHYLADTLGYMIHGLGAVPFAEAGTAAAIARAHRIAQKKLDAQQEKDNA